MTVRVLVTGAGGFIGRHIVAGLQRRGAEVHGCGRGRAVAGVNWWPADLLDSAAVARVVSQVRPDTVVHSAWFTIHGQFWSSPENAAWVAASAALAQEAFERGARRFIGVGTGAEYASDAPMPLDEETSRIAPETLYASAKDTTRRTLEILSVGRSFAWGRVFMLYGADEHPDRLVSSLSRALVRGETAKMSSGRAVRDFIDARDAGAALAALALSGVQGCVNIASGTPVSVRTLGENLARLSGNPELLSVGALPDRPNEPAATYASVARLRDQVGFKPSIALEDGLRDALEFWRRSS